jgi:hypothetical protein
MVVRRPELHKRSTHGGTLASAITMLSLSENKIILEAIRDALNPIAIVIPYYCHAP